MTDNERSWMIFHETQLLAALMMSSDPLKTLDDIAAGGVVDANDFGTSAIGTAFDAALSLAKEGSEITTVAIAGELLRRGQLDDVGGVEWLIRVMDDSLNTCVWHAKTNARATAKWSAQRKVVQIGRDIMERKDDFARPEEFLEMARSALSAVSLDDRSNSRLRIDEILDDEWARIEDRVRNGESIGIPFGYSEVDSTLLGLVGSELYVVGGRPGMGKTLFALNIAHRVAQRGNNVVVISLEMSGRELLERLLCIDGKIDQQSLKSGAKNADAIDRDLVIDSLHQSASRIKGMPLFVVDKSSQTVEEIAATCRKLSRIHGNMDVVVIDYLQLIQPEDKKVAREQQVAGITRALKKMAKDLNVAVVALAQLNRAIDSRTDKRPYLSDLRESGSVEQDADVVMFVHRPSYYAASDRPGEADLIVAKNRRGPLTSVTLTWRADCGRFEEFAQDDKYEAASNSFGNRTF